MNNSNCIPFMMQPTYVCHHLINNPFHTTITSIYTRFILITRQTNKESMISKLI